MGVVARARRNTFSALNIEETIARAHGFSDTDLFFREIIEEEPRPTDSYYFPLDTDASGYDYVTGLKTINPVTAANVSFDDNGAWVGRATTNLWPTVSGTYGWIGITGFAFTEARAFGSQYGFDIPSIRLIRDVGATNATHNTLDSSTVSVQSGETVTISTLLTSLFGDLHIDHLRLSRDVEGSLVSTISLGSHIPTFLGDGVWKTAYSSVSLLETLNAYPWIEVRGSGQGEARAVGMMVEKKPFLSAYTPTSRGLSVLTYNLHTSISLNWNADYTIAYWKRLHGTSNDTLTGEAYDSLGSTPNSVGGGFRRWGKVAGENTWAFQSATAAYNPEDVQYQWVWVVLRKTGAVQTNRVYLSDTSIISLDTSDTTSLANRYVNQFGYDLQLGGFNNSNTSNAYYKDVVVLKRALTNDELDAWYKTKLRVGASSVLAPSIEEEL